MWKQKDKPIIEAEPAVVWADWLKDDIPTVCVRTADSIAPPRTLKGLHVRSQVVTSHHPGSITGVPNRSPGLRRVSSVRSESERASQVLDMRHVKANSIPRRKSKSKQRAVTISLSLPKVRMPGASASKWIFGVVFVGVVIVGTPQLLHYRSRQAKQVADSQKIATPVYAPLKPTTGAGVVAGAGYDSKRQMYKYDDVYNGATMTVSQQPMPENLRANPEGIKEIAGSIGAKEKISTTNGDAYISTDDKTASQRVVLVHRQLLIFIQSSRSLSSVDWVTYIQKLE